MKRLPRPRRSLWLVLGLVIGVLDDGSHDGRRGPATGGPQLHAEVRGADDEHRRRRAWAKNYYGAPSRPRTGPRRVVVPTPLNLESNYAKEARSVASQGDNWLAARSNVPHRAIVLDVDDTTLDHLELRALQQLGLQRDDECLFVGLTNGAFTGNMFPATPGMVALANHATAPWAMRSSGSPGARRFAARCDDRQP